MSCDELCNVYMISNKRVKAPTQRLVNVVGYTAAGEHTHPGIVYSEVRSTSISERLARVGRARQPT